MSEENNKKDKVEDEVKDEPHPEPQPGPQPPTNDEPQTTNDKPQTSTMEVHKHPHDVTHKKKWTEYLLEFLMLFLAVFLGFVAENLREHKIEHSRAVEFSKSLVRDLQNDEAEITAHEKLSRIYIVITDSLLKLSQSKLEGRTAAEFSFYTRFIYWTVSLSWNRATFEQIKNSGSLRYFKNYALLEKLMNYDALVNDIKAEFGNHQVRGNMLLPLINQVIDPEFHHDISMHLLADLDTMSNQTKEYYFAARIESLENKREVIRQMLNMIVVQQRNLRLNVENTLPRAKELAAELENDLEKEYHLE